MVPARFPPRPPDPRTAQPIPKMASVTDEAEPTMIERTPAALLALAKESGIRPLNAAAFRPLPPRPAARATTSVPAPAPESVVEVDSSEAIEVEPSHVSIEEISDFEEVVAEPQPPQPQPQPLPAAAFSQPQPPPAAPSTSLVEDEVYAQFRPRPVIVLRTAWFFVAFAAKATLVWMVREFPRAIRAQWQRAAERAKSA